MDIYSQSRQTWDFSVYVFPTEYQACLSGNFRSDRECSAILAMFDVPTILMARLRVNQPGGGQVQVVQESPTAAICSHLLLLCNRRLIP